MKPRGSDEYSPCQAVWPEATEYPVLGHLISHDCSIKPAWCLVQRKAWRGFWCNFRAQSCKLLDHKLRLTILDRAVRPVADFRMSCWPLQSTVSQELDAVQRKMIGIVCPPPSEPGDTPETFVRRRRWRAGVLAKQVGTWSALWAKRATRWHDHVLRSRGPCGWGKALLTFRSEAWLRERRATFAAQFSLRQRAWSIFSGRTDTRVGPGKVQPRWEEAIRKVSTGS